MVEILKDARARGKERERSDRLRSQPNDKLISVLEQIVDPSRE